MIERREEFEDLDLVFKWKTAYRILHDPHGFTKPYYLTHNDEEIRVTCSLVRQDQMRQGKPYFLDFQRYIVGRPNLLHMPLRFTRLDDNPHFESGCMPTELFDSLYVWSFIDKYPPMLEVDIS